MLLMNACNRGGLLIFQSQRYAEAGQIILRNGCSAAFLQWNVYGEEALSFLCERVIDARCVRLRERRASRQRDLFSVRLLPSHGSADWNGRGNGVACSKLVTRRSAGAAPIQHGFQQRRKF